MTTAIRKPTLAECIRGAEAERRLFVAFLKTERSPEHPMSDATRRQFEEWAIDALERENRLKAQR